MSPQLVEARLRFAQMRWASSFFFTGEDVRLSGYKRYDSSMVKKSGHKVTVVLGLVVMVLLAWQVLDYARNSSLISLASSVVDWLRLNLSMWRITVIVGFGGTLLSIPFMRRRGRNRDAPEQAVVPESIQHSTVHPLMLTPRPSRDPQFVVRKTKKRGRIARNRDGERLPPTQPE